jgi:hypothetical protein
MSAASRRTSSVWTPPCAGNPLARAIYHSFVGRSEVIWSRRDQFDGLQRSVGFYLSGDYQLGRRWFAGARYDRSDRADQSSISTTGQSAILTYWPSEFSQCAGSTRRTDYGDGPTPMSSCSSSSSQSARTGAHPF